MDETLTPDVAPQATPPMTPEALIHLQIAAKWAKFLSVVGFVLTGFLILTGLSFAFIMKPLETQIPVIAQIPAILVTVVYIIFAAVFLLPVLFLNSFASNVPKAIRKNDSLFLTKACKNLKSLFAVIGLITILMLILYLFALLLIGGAALLAF